LEQYWGGENMSFGYSAHLTAVVRSDMSIGHQFESYALRSIHIAKVLSAHALELTQGDIFLLTHPLKYP